LFLEKVHKIIGRHQELKEGIVAGVLVRNYLVQPKTIYPFFDKILSTGPKTFAFSGTDAKSPF